jgi:hypothetical protein
MRGGIDSAETPLGYNRLRQTVAGVGFFVKRLTLEIRRLDEISIDQAQRAKSGAHQEIRHRGAHRSAADEDRRGSEQTLLSLLANSGEKDLAGEAVSLLRIHGFSVLEGIIIAPIQKEWATRLY